MEEESHEEADAATDRIWAQVVTVGLDGRIYSQTSHALDLGVRKDDLAPSDQPSHSMGLHHNSRRLDHNAQLSH